MMNSLPLKTRLIQMIHEKGPLRVDEYMQLCLLDRQNGFYYHLPRIQDHFTTSPEISPLFGEIIAAYLIYHWKTHHPQLKPRIIELGPGNGTLAFDLLSVWQKLVGDLVDYIAIEKSPSLQQKQQEKLKFFQERCRWISSVQEIFNAQAPVLNLIVANEFFDALSIRQWIKTQEQWFERVITARGNDLIFNQLPLEAKEWPHISNKALFFEKSEESLSIAHDIGKIMSGSYAMILVIDYGYETESNFKDTLQAVKNNAYCDVLSCPGEADLTAHVNFNALRSVFCAGGFDVHPLQTQRDFLSSCGIYARLDRLRRVVSPQAFHDLALGVKRLTSPMEMGLLFKVLISTSRGSYGY